MTPEDVTSENFRNAGIDKTAEQVVQRGGWMIITSPGHSVADIGCHRVGGIPVQAAARTQLRPAPLAL